MADLTGGEAGSSASECGVAESTLRHPLKMLRPAGIIATAKEGTRCDVALRPELEKAFPGLLSTVLMCRERTGQAAGTVHRTSGMA